MEKLFLWGAGFFAKKIVEECDIMKRFKILGFIDNNKDKQGCFFCGKKVYAPDILFKEKCDRIIILANAYEQISKQIKQLIPPNYSLEIDSYYYFYKVGILRRYRNNNEIEIKEIIDYLDKHSLSVFNYEFSDKYEVMDIDTKFDVTCGMYYVYHNGKKMYFARKYNTEEKVKRYYKSILLEQDEKSPHCYLDEKFNVMENDVVVDVGVAEGNFSLEIIERASKVYLVEADEEWIAALKQTFKEYENKIVFINKFAGCYKDGSMDLLDNLISENINFLKMDIEGNEIDALLGAEKLLKNGTQLKCAICAYHADYDEIVIKNILENCHIKCETTKGYMWFPYSAKQNCISTKLRKGIVRGKKW